MTGSSAYVSLHTGRFSEAMRGAAAIKNTLPDSLLGHPVMNRFFEAFLSVELHVLLRFGKWQEILDMPLPSTPEVRRGGTEVRVSVRDLYICEPWVMRCDAHVRPMFWGFLTSRACVRSTAT
jgi:hypothetical protein